MVFSATGFGNRSTRPVFGRPNSPKPTPSGGGYGGGGGWRINKPMSRNYGASPRSGNVAYRTTIPQSTASSMVGTNTAEGVVDPVDTSPVANDPGTTTETATGNPWLDASIPTNGGTGVPGAGGGTVHDEYMPDYVWMGSQLVPNPNKPLPREDTSMMVDLLNRLTSDKNMLDPAMLYRQSLDAISGTYDTAMDQAGAQIAQGGYGPAMALDLALQGQMGAARQRSEAARQSQIDASTQNTNILSSALQQANGLLQSGTVQRGQDYEQLQAILAALMDSYKISAGVF